MPNRTDDHEQLSYFWDAYPDDNMDDLTDFMMNPLDLDGDLDKQDMEQDDDNLGDIDTDDQNDLLDTSMSKGKSMCLHNNMVYTLLYKFVAQGNQPDYLEDDVVDYLWS